MVPEIKITPDVRKRLLHGLGEDHERQTAILPSDSRPAGCGANCPFEEKCLST